MGVKIQSIFLKQAIRLLFFNKNENIFGEINGMMVKVLRSKEKGVKIGLRRKIEGEGITAIFLLKFLFRVAHCNDNF